MISKPTYFMIALMYVAQRPKITYFLVDNNYQLKKYEQVNYAKPFWIMEV